MENNLKNQKIGTYAGLAFAIVIFQFLAPSIFDASGKSGFDFVRMLAAGITGGIGAVIGQRIVVTFGKKP